MSELEAATPFGDSTIAFAEARTVKRCDAALLRLVVKERNGGLGMKSGRKRRYVETGDDAATGVIAIVEDRRKETSVFSTVLDLIGFTWVLSFISSSLPDWSTTQL